MSTLPTSGSAAESMILDRSMGYTLALDLLEGGGTQGALLALDLRKKLAK